MLSVLQACNIIYLLQPYNEFSISKRIVKRPKIYFRDTGLACYLARVNTSNSLIASYLKGPMFETFVMNEILKSFKNNMINNEVSMYYLRNYDQQEIDLILINDGTITPIEIKSGEEYSKKNVSSFSLIKNSKYKSNGVAIICTTKSIYPIKEDVYAVIITAI